MAGRIKGGSAVPSKFPCGCPAVAGPKTYWKIKRLPGGVRVCLNHDQPFVLEWRAVSFKDVERIIHGRKRVVVRRGVPVGVPGRID